MKILKNILKDNFTKLAFWTLLSLYIAIIFANFISPYSATYTNREMSYVPPSNIYVLTQDGKWSRPYTYNYIRTYEPDLMQTVYEQDRTQKYYLKLFVKGESYKFLGIFNTSRHLFGVEAPGQLYLLGTDLNGRDVFSRLIFGGRISLTIGFLSLLTVAL